MKKQPLFRSFNYAIDGVVYVLRTQRNMRVHLVVAVSVLLLSLILGVDSIQFIILMIAIALVIISEFFNTAIESAIDITTNTYDPLAKIAKDVAAAAVLVSTLVAVTVGYLIFFPKLNSFSLNTLERVRQSPIHLTAIALILVIIAVMWAKAKTKTGTWLRGGWPSGHSAVAGSLFASIAMISKNALLATLALIMALLVFQSRREAKFHSVLQIISGGLIGVLITVIIFQLFFKS